MRFALVLLCTTVAWAADDSAGGTWAAYGHDGGGTRHSPLRTINRDNVKHLAIAWTYHVGDMFPGNQRARQSGFETTPLYVDGKLFLSTAFGRVIALNPTNGRKIWSFDPKVDISTGFGDFVNRGVSTWVDPRTHERRIFI